MFSPISKANLYLTQFGFFKVPLIWLCRPKILRFDDTTVEVKLPFKRRTRNHLNSMYFGAMMIGAEVAGGFLAISKSTQQGRKVSLAFKAVSAEFLKRPEADVHFTCHDGEKIERMLQESATSGKRINEPVTIVATCPSLHGDEPMATFELTLSLKML
ncbi:DUF4442 domain-containing protein [Vibrio sp.]|uniref:DUF4442 domain-containing protein n=1 Tax=Vibrio sp. TaxID=678 RepID=UPI003D1247D5